jgi:hemerythrin-like domain-containing protein
MTPLDTLIAEHIQIKRLVTILLAADESLRPEFFLQAAAFIRDYADGIHHCKEEGAFFGILKDGMSKAVEALLGEHALARQYTQAMEQAARAWQSGDESAAASTIQNARHWAALLHDHIAHEDNLLFPVAKWLLMPHEQADLEKHFNQLDQQCADAGQYLALLEALENQTSEVSETSEVSPRRTFHASH